MILLFPRQSSDNDSQPSEIRAHATNAEHLIAGHRHGRILISEGPIKFDLFLAKRADL